MDYISRKRLNKRIIGAGFLVMIGLMFFASTIGSANISFLDAIRIVLGKIPFVKQLVSQDGISETYRLIVLEVRMPRIVLAAMIGIGLSTVGAVFQGMFRNPLADPYILGVSSGAALGATIAMILGVGLGAWGIGLISVFSFIGAILTIVFVYTIARVSGGSKGKTLLLAGIAVSYLLSSGTSLMMFFNRDQIEKIVLWTMGSVSAASWTKVGILFPVIAIGTLVFVFFAREMNAIAIGEDTARSVGIHTARVNNILIVASTLVVACCVSVSGIIGFVGLMIPHMVRLVMGSDHRIVIPLSAAVGGIFLVLCDTLARSIVPPTEIPVGAITSLFGAPFFIFLLCRNRKRGFHG